MNPQYLIVVDLEANCMKNRVIQPQEVTEFPCVVIDTAKGVILDNVQFHRYCKLTGPPLTEFATELTGITKDLLDTQGIPFPKVLYQQQLWMKEHGLNTKNSLTVTCGDWDFNVCLPGQCRYSKIGIPAIFKRWCNVKRCFESTVGYKAKSMVNMLKMLGLPLNGRHHSGIDDTKNIAAACVKLLKLGAVFKPTRTCWRKLH